MKRKLATIYAVFCTLLLVAGFLLVFYFAFNEGVTTTVKCLVGLALGFILSPIFHELGHVSFGLIAKMDYVYVKCFCFKIYLKNGKKRLGFASPFSADETQVLPIKGGNMEKRAAFYTLGGLIYSGGFLALILAAVILTACLGNPSYKMLGMLPYAAYLFFLNLPPFEYVGGKTDGLIYKGIKKGYDAEKCMLSVMEIQGQLSEGKSFSEIDEKYYFDINNPHFEFLEEYLEDRQFLSDTNAYIKACYKYYDYKKSQEPLIQAQKEFEKKKREFLREVKMSKELPTKKQLYYYERLCKKYNIEQTELTSKLQARDEIDKIIKENL